MRFINTHRYRFGVEPICQTLEVAPSTYYDAINRPASARALRDEELRVEVARVHKENFAVYGIEKAWRQLRREGFDVGRDRIARLMRDLGLEGAVRGKKKRTTIPDQSGERPTDLVDRKFSAEAPNRLGWECRSSSRASAGVRQASVLRGRPLRAAATAARSPPRTSSLRSASAGYISATLPAGAPIRLSVRA